MSIIINENALLKIEKNINKLIKTPIVPLNTAVDAIQDKLSVGRTGQKLMDYVEADPSKQSKGQNAKEWAGMMGAGSLLAHAPQIATGDIISPLSMAAANAAKGAVIGPQLTGGQDTLLKSTLIPAGVMAISTPLFNMAGESLGFESEADFDPYARVPITGAIGAGLWAFRNRKKGDRQYV